jgi:deoxyribonuclease-4
MIRLGIHISTRHGYKAAAGSAAAAGMGAFQYFPKNPRSLHIKSFDQRDARSCAQLCDARGIVSIAHGPYPVNPAAEGEQAQRMALSTLNDLEIAECCGSLGVVVHFGIYKGADPLQGYRNVIRWLDAVTKVWTGSAKVLLENQAGDHGPFGTTPEELAQIRQLCAYPERIGFCLDTCHLFASGEWQPGRWTEFAARAEKAGFWSGLAAVHLNDSRHASGSRRDRHAVMGEGKIGEAMFRELLAAPQIRDKPLILETPAGKDGKHERQLAVVRHWAEEA